MDSPPAHASQCNFDSMKVKMIAPSHTEILAVQSYFMVYYWMAGKCNVNFECILLHLGGCDTKKKYHIAFFSS